MTVQGNNWLGPEAGSRMVVAGGCGGIGRVLVEDALRHGVDVTVLDLPRAMRPGNQVDGARYIGFDARDEMSIQNATTEVAKVWDRVDAFVFLCGYPILPRRPLETVSLKDWNDLMAVNVTSAHLLANGLLALLRRSSQASIITVVSSLAYQVMPGMGTYATSKGALVSLSKALAMELAPHIRVNAVAPGAVDTEFLGGGTGREALGADRSWFDAMQEKYSAMVPLGRVARPADVTGPIFFLSGPGAAYMTGQVLHLNGGRLTP